MKLSATWINHHSQASILNSSEKIIFLSFFFFAMASKYIAMESLLRSVIVLFQESWI